MKFLITLLTLFTFTVSFSQEENKAEPILEKLSQKMKSLNSFYIEFSASIKNSVSETNESANGKGWVKGDKYYASYGDNTIISNGVTTWTIIKEEKSVYKTDASEDDDESINPGKLMTIWEDGFKSKYIVEENLGTERVHKIYLFPKNAGDVEYHTIVIYIGVNDGELKKTILKMKDGTKMTYRLTKFTENPDVSDSKFVFDEAKYPGYTVIED